MTIQIVAAEIARLAPDLARDSVINRESIILGLLYELNEAHVRLCWMHHAEVAENEILRSKLAGLASGGCNNKTTDEPVSEQVAQ